MLRLRRRRQDHHCRAHRHGGRPQRPSGGGRDHRPGTTARRRTRSRGADQRTVPHRRRLARRAVGPDARHQVDVRRARPPLLGDRGPVRGDPHEQLLQEHLRVAVGHAGVHGDGEALRARGRGRLRPRGRRHAADPQRARLPGGAAPAGPLPRPPALPGPHRADQGLREGRQRRRPDARAGAGQGGRRRRGGRRDLVLPGLRGHGRGLQGPGPAGRRPPDRRLDGVRAGRLAQGRHRGRGRLLRRAAARPGA